MNEAARRQWGSLARYMGVSPADIAGADSYFAIHDVTDQVNYGEGVDSAGEGAASGATKVPVVSVETVIGGAVGGGVRVNGQNPGDANRCSSSLGEKTGLTLSVASDHLFYDTPYGPPSRSQSLVMAAINSPTEVILDCSTTPDKNILFGVDRDFNGHHAVDLADTGLLESRLNNTSNLSEGGVVLHELAEAYAETAMGLSGRGNFQQAHAFASTFAPGIYRDALRQIPTEGRVSGLFDVYQLNDGSGEIQVLMTFDRLKDVSSYYGNPNLIPRGNMAGVWGNMH